MFEATKVGRTVGKQEFKAQRDELRTQLLEAQRDLRKSDTPVIVIVSGVEAAGKGEVVNRLNEWLDTRGVQTFAFWELSDEERERPRYWRFWRTLPLRGEISILFGGWYLAPIEYRFQGLCDDAALDAELNRIVEFERMMTHDGALVVKFWFHLSEQDQKRRLKELSRDDRSRWKMLPEKSKFSEQYHQFEHVAERVIRQSDRGICPWYLIEAENKRYRDLTVGKTLLQAIRARLNEPVAMEPPTPADRLELPESDGAQITLLDQMDLTLKLDRDSYKAELKLLQQEINELSWEAYKQHRSTVLVFEGVDAGGKGGAIRRITSAVDARLYRTMSVAAPSDEEKAHHYLWRFWRHVPRVGHMIIYDRSWYGRVLVERVEGFAKEAEWRRAYSEINEFEEQLVENGAILRKFWLQVSDQEQLRRFQDREDTPYKRYKITDEDWRNREKWPEYKAAVNEMVARTSTEDAPWTLVEGDDKPFARIKVLRTVCDAMRKALHEQKGKFTSSGVTRCGDQRMQDKQ
ncbi:MAG TPA: polyphosphate:AMP phosphotransferase [Chromatiaceae bacterium]|jgi:polyphosphate:AMP phosphotransferase|nr:MAG: polyphosphate-dependent AMP kinase [Thiohalocapsa sp. PB-PSB1]QQO57027.1 MAG: polyphosphate:AMP phosphotransferase [Thiohalocapsa sp. PB-PSB1]HBG95760.1 polyphosphate:AMP phosphotransferase [Chromatiaceae bacterium]HCS92496.1 polyphosphate:AMP phosphotransferase [Chromatiaceae bacterium]